MPLDPDVVALLAAIEQDGGTPVEQATPVVARADSWSWLKYVGDPQPVPRVVHSFIPGPTAELPVRIYYPEGDPPFPAVVFFHGSGWTIANIEIADAPHRALANATGAVVIAVNYQKAPEHKFPVPLDDAYASTQWVMDHATGLGLDPARIGVGGDSAGANLATAACLRARDEGAPVPAFQVLVYPVTDHGNSADYQSRRENAEGYLLTTAAMDWFWRQYLSAPEEGEHPYASPVNAADLSGLPPAVVLTAEFDPLRDEGEHYADLMARAGVKVIKRRYDGMVHAFLWMSGSVGRCTQIFADIGRDIRELAPESRDRQPVDHGRGEDPDGVDLARSFDGEADPQQAQPPDENRREPGRRGAGRQAS